MYKWYKLENYKPYWTNEGVAFPESHIEDLITILGIGGFTVIDNKVQWNFPMSESYLFSTQSELPQYLKCSDGKQNFYFYLKNIDNVLALNKDNEFTYKGIYALDIYMTTFHNKLKILRDNKAKVLHLKKFTNRVDWTENNEGKVEKVIIDFLKHKEFGNTLTPFNTQMVRNYIYGTNPDLLYKHNFTTILPDNITFTLWNGTNNITIPKASFNTPNDKNRFSYIVCKSSALQKTSNSLDVKDKGAKETKLIIPLFSDSIDKIYDALLNIDFTTTQDNSINPFGGDNFIGAFECDIPYSMWVGESLKDNSPVKLKYAINNATHNIVGTETKSYEICFFEIPLNFAPKWTIIKYDDYTQGLDGKLKNIINNLDKVSIDTEPTLLNPAYYQERMVIDNTDKYISTDMSLLNYQIDFETPLGLDIKARVLFDTDISITYDYEDYNNQLNPIWNNKESNLRASLDTQLGVYGSSANNYYANNLNSTITGLQNFSLSKTQHWVNTGFNFISSLAWAGMAGAFNPIAGITGLIGSGFNFLKGTTNNIINHISQQRQIGAQIQNIYSSPNITLTNPFVDNGNPNKIIDGNYLFNTYSNELHPWDKDKLFRYLLYYAYPYNKIEDINTFKNRQYMNVLQVDTTYHTDYLMKTLRDNDNSIYNTNDYNLLFLGWLNDLHHFYTTPYIVNVINPEDNDYINNVEINLNPLLFKKTNINTIITNTNIDGIRPNLFINKLKELNPNAPTDMWDYISYTNNNNRYVIITLNNDKYYGNIITSIVVLPETLILKAMNGYKQNLLDSYALAQSEADATFSIYVNNKQWPIHRPTEEGDIIKGFINFKLTYDNASISFDTIKENYNTYNIKLIQTNSHNEETNIYTYKDTINNYGTNFNYIGDINNKIDYTIKYQTHDAGLWWSTRDFYTNNITFESNYLTGNCSISDQDKAQVWFWIPDETIHKLDATNISSYTNNRYQDTISNTIFIQDNQVISFSNE